MPILFDHINFLLIVTAFLNLLLGGIIFFNGPTKKTNITYSAICVSLLAWIIGMILFRSAPPQSGIFWCTVLYVAAAFIPSIYLYFTYIFPTEEKNILPKVAFIFTLNAVIVLMTIWPGFIIKDVIIRPGAEKEIIFTNYYWFYFLYISIFFTFGFYRLFLKYSRSKGIEKQQILYLLLGDVIAANGAFVTNLIMPWIGFFFLNWLGQFLTVIMVGFASYAIVRYRLMDIRIVARKVFVYLGVGTFVYGVFYLLLWFYDHTLGGPFTNSAYAFSLLLAPIFVMGFYTVDRGMRVFANKYLFVSLYNYQETIKNLSRELTYHNNLTEIIDSIVSTIEDTMRLNRAGVLLVDRARRPAVFRIAKVIGFNEKNGISLVKDNFLTQQLESSKLPLVADELLFLARNANSAVEKKGLERLYKNMNHIEASLCLPLINEGKLIGIIVLGAKLSGGAYTNEDLELLATLANQAGIAINNAQLYQQVKDFNLVLQSKIDAQTKELKKEAKELEEKNINLNKLLEVKNDFLRVVNHQLNTPVSIIKNSIYMIKSGAFTQEKGLEFIDEGVKRMQEIITDFWKAFSFEGEGIKLDLQETNLEEIVDRLVDNAANNSPLVKSRGLTVKSVKSFIIPHVKSDAKQITQAASNLLENAISYTNAGSVIVSYEKVDDFLKVFVKDTGVGIDLEDQTKIFEKFVRGRRATHERPGGSGLGLYIAKKIVEANGGKMKLEESEVGKGSTFSFTVPIWK
jgi:signal transduction histidine kinase